MSSISAQIDKHKENQQPTRSDAEGLKIVEKGLTTDGYDPKTVDGKVVFTGDDGAEREVTVTRK